MVGFYWGFKSGLPNF